MNYRYIEISVVNFRLEVLIFNNTFNHTFRGVLVQYSSTLYVEVHGPTDILRGLSDR